MNQVLLSLWDAQFAVCGGNCSGISVVTVVPVYMYRYMYLYRSLYKTTCTTSLCLILSLQQLRLWVDASM